MFRVALSVLIIKPLYLVDPPDVCQELARTFTSVMSVYTIIRFRQRIPRDSWRHSTAVRPLSWRHRRVHTTICSVHQVDLCSMQSKDTVRYLLQRCLHESDPEAVYDLESGSWSVWYRRQRSALCGHPLPTPVNSCNQRTYHCTGANKITKYKPIF